MLAAGAGLVTLGSSTPAWVAEESARAVGGVDVAEVAEVSGLEIRPELLIVGLALLLLAVPIGATSGVRHRVIGFVVAGIGLAGVVLAAAGIYAATTIAGQLRPAAWWTVIGCVAGFMSGVLALRQPARAALLPTRFDLNTPDIGSESAAPNGSRTPNAEPAPVDEWHLAADDD